MPKGDVSCIGHNSQLSDKRLVNVVFGQLLESLRNKLKELTENYTDEAFVKKLGVMTKAADVTIMLPLAGPAMKSEVVVLEQDCCSLSMVGAFARHKTTHLCQLVYHHEIAVRPCSVLGK